MLLIDGLSCFPTPIFVWSYFDIPDFAAAESAVINLDIKIFDVNILLVKICSWPLSSGD
jgi:hypothetical protein